MAMRFGRCINFGACTKADTKEAQPMPVGATDVVCKECGKPLVAIQGKKQGLPVAALAVIALVLLAGAFGVSRFFGGAKATAPAPSSAPSSAATVTRSTTAPPPTAAKPSSALAFALCGSNTIGSQLGPDLVRAFLKAQGAQTVADSGTATDEQTITSSVNGSAVNVRVAAHGSATAFNGLAAGDCQVGMASRRITTAEAAKLHSLGNMLSSSSEHVIGLDGIAVVVNAANPVTSLTASQLKAIFTGQVTSWKALGGDSRPIAVLARDAKSGTFDTFTALVLDKASLVRSARRFEDSAQLSAAVSADPDAIGFIGLPYIAQAKAVRVASGGNAIAPTPLTIGRESYPLTRRLFLYTAASSRSPFVSKFVSFVQSDAGQSLVNKDGFVGTVTSQATSRSTSRTLSAGTPARYRSLVDSLDQVSFNFYFNTGSDMLDNKALVDVGRLVNIMSSPANRSKKVVLVGFADSTGVPQANQRLSESRARSAAKELEAEGISIKDTMGFGQELPIRDNSTDSGREKNRRVEIFLTR